jgi:hypothetical protein
MVARDQASDTLVKLGAAAVPALLNGLKSPHLYERGWTVQTLSRIKPLPKEAADALVPLQHDPSAIISGMATDALAGKPISARDIIGDKDNYTDDDDEDKRDAELKAFVTGNPVQDNKHYARAEMIAAIPPDANHQYPLKLEYLIPVVEAGDIGLDAPFVITVHAAKDQPDRLTVWKKIGEDQYQRLFTELAEEDSRFDLPEIFSAKVLVKGRGQDHDEPELFLDLPLYRYWGDGAGVTDTVFAVDYVDDDAVLRPVTIEPVDEAKVLRPGEWIWNSFGNTFADDHLGFSFHIWEKDQCHACRGGAEVTGTYKMVDEEHYDDDKKAWMSNWTMVPDSIDRGPTTNSTH